MNVSILTCGGGAPWEAALVRGLQQGEFGIDVLRRCVEHVELLDVALRERPRAVIVAAELPWLERELICTLQDAGIAVIAIESTPGLRPPERTGVAIRMPATATADDIAGLVHGLAAADDELEALSPHAGTAPRDREPDVDDHAAGASGEIIAVWGGPGAPGRTTVAVHLAIEFARGGRRVLLVDADAWAPSIAQLLGLDESPGITNAARLATDGWPRGLETCLQHGPSGVSVMAGLARADLWPEVRERSWLTVLDECRTIADVVIVDVAAPIEEDEELAFDQAPYRRNTMTRVVLGQAACVVEVVAGDPVGLRRGIFAFRDLSRELPSVASNHVTVVNRAPTSARRLQDCSVELERWTGSPPAVLLPTEDAFDRVVWEGRPLHQVAARSTWLRELRALRALPVSDRLMAVRP